VKQKELTLPEHPSSLFVYYVVRIAQSSVFYVVLCGPLFVFFFFFFVISFSVLFIACYNPSCIIKFIYLFKNMKKKDKQWATKYYIENRRLSYANHIIYNKFWDEITHIHNKTQLRKYK
jgi:hypothetical protein